jgi:hypothetical protein
VAHEITLPNLKSRGTLAGEPNDDNAMSPPFVELTGPKRSG